MMCVICSYRYCAFAMCAGRRASEPAGCRRTMYICIYRERDIYIYIHTHLYGYVYIYIYIYTYTYREREMLGRLDGLTACLAHPENTTHGSFPVGLISNWARF